MSDEVSYEEAVIFWQWVLASKVPYPLNESLQIWLSSYGLRVVLSDFVLEEEYHQWLVYRASAQQQLGERFLPDWSCNNLRRASDEEVQKNRAHDA